MGWTLDIISERHPCRSPILSPHFLAKHPPKGITKGMKKNCEIKYENWNEKRRST